MVAKLDERYLLIFGSLFREYTGTTACTGLGVYGRYRTKAELEAAQKKCLDETSELMIAIDLTTGKEVE